MSIFYCDNNLMYQNPIWLNEFDIIKNQLTGKLTANYLRIYLFHNSNVI